MNPFPRRTFLHQSLAGLVLAPAAAHIESWQAAGLLPWWWSAASRVRYALHMLQHAQFQACLGQCFQMQLESGSTAELTLIETTTHPEAAAHDNPTPNPSKRQPFSVIFRGPKNPAWPQRIYRLNHPSLGQLDIFLVPIGPDNEGQRYEAVFN